MICSLIIIFQGYNTQNHTVYYRDKIKDSLAYDPLYNKDATFNLYRKDVTNDIDNIGVRFATYERTNDAEYRLEILKNDKVVEQQVFNAKNLEDMEYYYFDVNTIPSEDLIDYQIRFHPIDNDPNNTITVLCDQNQNLAISLNKNNDLITIKFIVLLLLMILFFALNYIVNTKDLSITKMLLITGVYFILITVLIPPYMIPDEKAHFVRTMNVSQYSFSKTPYENFMNPVFEFPKNGTENINYAKIQRRDAVVDMQDIGKALENQSKNVDEVSVHTNTNTAISYVIPAIAIKIVDTFSNSPLLIFFIGRFAALIINFYFLYLAIKITPKFKKIFFLIATMPMLVQTTGSYSYDGLLNSLCLIFLAFSVKCIYEKKVISIQRILIMLGILALIMVIKIPYSLLGVLVFFIPLENFGNNKIKKIGSIIGSGLGVYALYHLIIMGSNIGTISPQNVITSSGPTNLDYLLQQPTRIFSIAFNTLKMKWQFYIESFIGYFGYFQFKMHWIFAIAFGSTYMATVKEEEGMLTKRQKILLFVIIVFLVVGIFGALYLTWSTYQLPFVDGVQGRYFIPLLIPISLILISTKVKITQLKKETLFNYVNIVLLQFVLLVLINIY
jgi:uncharacterized membrane protein